MADRHLRRFLAAAVLGSLGWAVVEARHIEIRHPPRQDLAARSADPTTVEGVFSEIQSLRAAGQQEEAILALREQTSGVHAGYAWFLLGEIAYEEGAYASAVQHYRSAVELEPSLTDRKAAFGASGQIEARLQALRSSPWAEDAPRELRDLYYLQRRLAGGCE